MMTYSNYHRVITLRIIKRIMIVIMIITLALISIISGYTLAFASSSYNDYHAAKYIYQRTVVKEGDTLWGLAAAHSGSSDINLLVQETIQYNNLAGSYIQPGQVIYIATK